MKMATKPKSTIDARTELAELVKRKAEIAVIKPLFTLKKINSYIRV